MVSELVALYDSHRSGRAGLPPPQIQFGDFAAWQREQFPDARTAAELAPAASWPPPSTIGTCPSTG